MTKAFGKELAKLPEWLEFEGASIPFSSHPFGGPLSNCLVGCSTVAIGNAEDINWSALRLFYTRRKLAKRGGGRAFLAVGPKMEAVLRQLPSTGPLFPHLRLLSEDERASYFRKVCMRVGVSGVTLHSYR